MKIDLTEPIISFSGEAIQGLTTGKVLASAIENVATIAGLTTSEAHNIGVGAYRGEIDLTVKEREAIETFIENSSIFIIAKQPLQKAFEKAKNKK